GAAAVATERSKTRRTGPLRTPYRTIDFGDDGQRAGWSPTSGRDYPASAARKHGPNGILTAKRVMTTASGFLECRPSGTTAVEGLAGYPGEVSWSWPAPRLRPARPSRWRDERRPSPRNRAPARAGQRAGCPIRRQPQARRRC